MFSFFSFWRYFKIGNSRQEIEKAIKNNPIIIPPNTFSNSLNKILNGLLEKDENKRINLNYIIENLLLSEESKSNDSSPREKIETINQKEVL